MRQQITKGSYVCIKSVRELKSILLWSNEIDSCGSCCGIPLQYIDALQGQVFKVINDSGIYLQNEDGKPLKYSWAPSMLKLKTFKFNQLLNKE